MKHFDRVLAAITRYAPRWYETMHVVDLATWLCNWEKDLPEVYIEAMAVKKATSDAWELAHASKLSQAVYIALTSADTLAVSTPGTAARIDQLAAERRSAAPPYNREGGAS